MEVWHDVDPGIPGERRERKRERCGLIRLSLDVWISMVCVVIMETRNARTTRDTTLTSCDVSLNCPPRKRERNRDAEMINKFCKKLECLCKYCSCQIVVQISVNQFLLLA